jgi:hypothetical protein
VEAPDSSDLDALRELVRTPGYALLVERIHFSIACAQKALEEDAGAERTWLLRGQIRAWRIALKMPEILKDEISNEVKHGKTDDGRA